MQPDEIGPWSEIKLEIIEKYGPAYTRAFSQQGRNLKKFYIDGFSGAGLHVSKGTKEAIEGSPARALKVSPPFDGFYFIDLNKDKTDYLRKQCEGRRDVHHLHWRLQCAPDERGVSKNPVRHLHAGAVPPRC